MNLAGQGNAHESLGPRSRLDDRGYVMVVLLIGIAVTAVWMGALLPSWHQQAVRQKEADLIFRGEQYARAIALYYRKNNQTLPASIDILVSQHFLRKKYLDPITGKDFLPVAAGFSQAQGGRRGQSPAPQAPQVQLGGGISGVRSTSTDTSIRVYNGQQTYSQFAFDYTTALQKMGAATPNGGGNGLGRGSGVGISRGSFDDVPLGRGNAPIGGGQGRQGRGTDGPGRPGGPGTGQPANGRGGR